MTIRTVVVTVPVRDEERDLPSALTAIDTARAVLLSDRPDLRVHVVVALDRCTDRSAEIARAADVHRVVTTAGRVGAARAAAATRALQLAALDGSRLQDTWLASTDADTVVPPHWLAAQLALAATGLTLCIGTVEPDAADPRLLADWHTRHDLREGHGHVHGANLGIRGDCYERAGGFPDVALHEDVALVRRAMPLGPWLATDTLRVRTSGRRTGRAPGGFAAYLRRLGGEPPIPAPAPEPA